MEWEDLLVMVFGVDWRCERDNCGSLQDWMSKCVNFLDAVCLKWDLFNPRSQETGQEVEAPTQAAPGEKRRKVDSHPLEKLPPHHGDGAPPVMWGGKRQHFLFVTDCKPLATIASGHTALKTEGMEPLFARIAANLFNMLAMGWTPAGRWGD